MDRFLLRLFQREVLLQCQFVLFAAEQLAQVHAEDEQQEQQFAAIARDVHAKLQEAGGNIDARQAQHERQREAQSKLVPMTERIWFALQNVLVSAANLSKLLWGSSGKREHERVALRDSIGVDNTSVLKSLDIRNDFEHFDERIEDWYVRQGQSGYVGRNIGSGVVHIEDEDENEGRRFGEYDPSTGGVIFWTHSVCLPEIVGEVRRILPLVEAETAKPSWESL